MASHEEIFSENTSKNGMDSTPEICPDTQPMKTPAFQHVVLPPIGSSHQPAVSEAGDSGDTHQGAQCVDIVDQEMDDDEPMDDLERSSSNLSDVRFDTCIGHIEDIIMEDEFQSLQQSFLDQYYTEFEDTEENKFSYTDIHNQYVQTIERYLNDQLTRRMPDFNMAEFAQQLQSRRNDELFEGEIFEMLLTFTDFLAFKEMMLDHRAEKEGRSMDLSGMLTVTKRS